jgi:hypothetical protein
MITEKHFFYILGYPRCRSTWFSQFFSTNVSFCYHEMLSGNDDNAFYKHMYDFARPYVGSADTNAISFARAKRKAGPIVLVYRPESEVVESLLKAFDPHPAFTKKEWERYVKNTTEMMGIILDWYRANERNMMKVDFCDLEDEQVIMRIFKFCVPAYDPDWAYIRNLNNLRITLKNRGGMTNGIEFSCENRNKSIEEFKADHLEKYDREQFAETISKWQHEAPKPKEQERRHIITLDEARI